MKDDAKNVAKKSRIRPEIIGFLIFKFFGF